MQIGSVQKAEINLPKVYYYLKYQPQSSEVVLFFHGLACSSSSFQHVFDQDYFPNKSILVLDLIGFGNSPKPEDFSYTMEVQAQVIQELLSIFPKWKIHIVAHSMGAAIALLLSQEIFSRVDSFSNIEGNLIAEDCGIMSREISKASFEEYKSKTYKMHSFFFKNHEQLQFNRSTPFAIYHSAVSLVKKSDSGILLERFRKLNCPKSYFYGEENKDIHVLKKIDFATKYMITNSGHSMSTQNPEEFYMKLAEFIGSLRN